MSYYREAEKDLIGRVIDKLDVSIDRQSIDIQFRDGGKAHGTVYGDCCSSSWIEDITIPSGINGAVILSIQESDVVGPVGDSRNNPLEWEEEVKVYNVAIATSRGEIIIEFRNSSNGYYGGWIEWSTRQ